VTTRNPPTVLVSVATYNEIDNLPQLVDELFRAAPDVHLLVVDDQSPDGTGAWCDQYSTRDSRLRCLHRSGKLGLGTAIIAGLRWAIDHDYDVVVHLDGDLSHSPSDVPRLLARLLGEDRAAPGPNQVDTRASDTRDNLPSAGHDHCPDVVIGSRYVSGGGVENWPWLRRLMSRAVNTYCRWLLRIPVRDCSGGFRAYRVSLLRQLDFSQLEATGYALLEELLFHCHRAGAVLSEVPIVFRNRRHGSSKVSLAEAWGVLTVVWKNRRRTS
jgi:dolichol-phosphate mannosyltransferase